MRGRQVSKNHKQFKLNRGSPINIERVTVPSGHKAMTVATKYRGEKLILQKVRGEIIQQKVKEEITPMKTRKEITPMKTRKKITPMKTK